MWIYKMGSGISMSEREMNKQEEYVQKHFAVAKKNMSKYKDDGYNRYSDMQIEMKLRQEYHNRPYSYDYQKPTNDHFIPQREWKNWSNMY